MENKFIEDEIELKEINNIKALYYKVNYLEQKVNEDPVFRRWLESQKKERGENGIVSYCQNCNLFFYFINKNEESELKKNVVIKSIMDIFEIIVTKFFFQNHFVV